MKSKHRRPADEALTQIEVGIGQAKGLEDDKQIIAELRAWAAVLKGCAIATLSEDSEGLGIGDSMYIGKSILLARKIEARRKQ